MSTFISETMGPCYRRVRSCVATRGAGRIARVTAAGNDVRLAGKVATALAFAAVAAASLLFIPDPLRARAALVVGVCLVLWLSEAVPLYATTIVLWAGVALLLGPLDPKVFSLNRVLTWAA